MTPVRLEPAAPRSPVKHSTTEPLHTLVQTRVTGKSNTLFKLAESLWTLGHLLIFVIFLCVRIEIDSPK